MTTRGKWLDNRLHKNRTVPKLTDNNDGVPQYFQVSVNILEGKRLAWANPNLATSYVIIVYDNKKYRTSLRQNMRVPIYREKFVFEQSTTIKQLLRSCLWLAVMESQFCDAPRVLGESTVELAYVWGQPHHMIIHKWALLTQPTDAESPTGYLKVDISISCRRDVIATPGDYPDMEGDVLLPYGSEQPASYQVTVYRAYRVSSSSHCRPHMLSKPPSTLVRVTFSGLTGETSVQHRTNDPVYNERVSIVEMFPNACQLIRLEVCSVNEGSKVLASTHLSLPQISHGGDYGFLPTFGPSLLHMYGPWSSESAEDGGPYYRGALLVAMKTIVPYYKQCPSSVSVKPAFAASETDWAFEDFVVYCPIFEVSMLDKSVCGSFSGVAVTLGDIPCSSSIDQEFVRLLCEINQRKLHYTGALPVQSSNSIVGNLEFEKYPVLQIAARLPEFRFRMYRNNVLLGIVDDLEKDLLNIAVRLVNDDYCQMKDLLEALYSCKDDTAAKILKFLDIVEYCSCNEDIQKYTTELDRNIAELQKEKITKIYRRLTSKSHNSCMPHLCVYNRSCDDGEYKKRIKRMLAEGLGVVQDLKELIFKSPDGWPNISVWLLNNGSRVAYAEIAPALVVHSVIAEQRGPECGKIQTLYLKPIKCPKHLTQCCCIVGKVELLAWLGAFRRRAAFQSSLPVGYEFSYDGNSVQCQSVNLECSVYLYRAKLSCTCDHLSLSSFVRVHLMNDIKESQIQYNTVNPAWNEVIRFSCLANISQERLETSPPEILLEVYQWDTTQMNNACLLGRAKLIPIVADPSKDPPALEWFDVLMGTEHVGKLQMSAQITLMSECVAGNMDATRTSQHQDLDQRPSYQVAQVLLDPGAREPLPEKLLPATNVYKMDVYWWGLRNVSAAHKPCVTLEYDDVIVKSTIITDCKPNCNFTNDKISQTFQGDFTNGSSPLTVKLYDSTSFGRTLFIGSNVVKRPKKFAVNWITKKEREQSLLMKPIITNAFMQVSRTTLVKRHTVPITEHPEEFSYKEDNSRAKSFWGKIFPKETDEEAITLLPTFFKERKMERKNLGKKEDDWWTRYYGSLEDRAFSDKEPSENRLKIYDSELENQPGFSRFKDWCSTIKLYSGTKTGIPEKDEQLLCGSLKVSIAVYPWPPPSSTVVSHCGVDLDKGYFDGHPDNDPARYLVRIYAVKCSSLVSKGFTTTSKCYVTAQCGSKELGDRNSCVPRSADPVFGKMFELECSFPEDYLLKVSVMDCGPALPDRLIGSTSVDLENRAYTKHRSTVGLSTEYKINGPNRWRDNQRPSAILEQLCEKNHLPPLEYPDPSTVLLNGVEYKDLESGIKYASPLIRKENICLSILQKWHTLPICGYRLVPEHVEARTLYDPEKPGVDQGKIHLWIDMFILDCGRSLPPPLDITPRPSEEYELRVVVREVQEVKLVNKHSNIFVKGWIGPSDEAQDTDIYYTSISGEGHFNWRMVFQFLYRHTEKKLLLHDKGPFTEVTELFPPILIVQVLDVEAPNPEDFLGTLMLDLSAMPRGARTTRQCTPDIMRRNDVDLFTARSCRGWWPLKMVDRNTGNYYFAGMIHLEISLLPREKAIIMPVGLGRDPPLPLSEPVREPSSTGVDCPYDVGNSQPLAIIAIITIGACVFWILVEGFRIP